jgi:hypothetical protein
VAVAQRSGPSRALLRRDLHRRWLTLHFLVLSIGLVALVLANRFLTPDRFWAHWAALGWGGLFVTHLVVFSRATLATMGGRRGG